MRLKFISPFGIKGGGKSGYPYQQLKSQVDILIKIDQQVIRAIVLQKPQSMTPLSDCLSVNFVDMAFVLVDLIEFYFY